MVCITFWCVLLLSVVAIGEAALCIATVGCPNNASLCTLNCSAIAVNEFNQPASHGNCRLSYTVDGVGFQDCYIHECNTSVPERCLLQTGYNPDHLAAHCCCTEYHCNYEFYIPDNNTDSGDSGDPPGDLGDPADPPDDTNNTHIYSTYPTHIGPNDVVCLHKNCTDDVCEPARYEVCVEHPYYGNFSRHICHAFFTVFEETVKSNYYCFSDEHSPCTEECIPALHSSSPKEAMIYDCCCTGNMCNNITFNISVLPSNTMISSSPTATTVNASAITSPKDDNGNNLAVIYGVVIGVSLFILLVSVLIVVIFYCYYVGKSKNNGPLSNHLPNPLINSSDPVVPIEGIDNVELVKQVGRGRFATVWKAVMNNSSVAIKVFPVCSMESWNHEKDIYTTPYFEHNCLLHFIGAEQRTVNYETQYWIATAYHEYGSLMDFLRVRTINLDNLCVMAESVAMGLSHLHSTFTRNGRYKPAIVHRDFKSKNVLVKEDLSCVISDFGLAFKFVSGESPVEAQGQVGTTRYMSPEVLEGAVNFQREAFMRIDMYACGLVLWEMTTRCAIDDTNPGEYMQPFEDELKGNPSIEMMKQVVIAAKKRPEFPKPFNVNPQLESLVTTITECWDDDAEARLSAKTVEERIKGLRRDICKPAIIDNEKDVGLMVSLTPSQSMPVFPGKELSSGISCSLPNSYSTLTSPRSNVSLTFSPKLTDRNQNNVFPETSSPTQLTNGYMNVYPMQNGHAAHAELMNSNGSSNKNHKAIAVHNEGLTSRVNGRIHSFSETTL